MKLVIALFAVLVVAAGRTEAQLELLTPFATFPLSLFSTMASTAAKVASGMEQSLKQLPSLPGLGNFAGLGNFLPQFGQRIADTSQQIIPAVQTTISAALPDFSQIIPMPDGRKLSLAQLITSLASGSVVQNSPALQAALNLPGQAAQNALNLPGALQAALTIPGQAALNLPAQATQALQAVLNSGINPADFLAKLFPAVGAAATAPAPAPPPAPAGQ